MQRFRRTVAAIASTCAVLLVAGCSQTADGQAVSPLYDPNRVAGLAVTEGPSGPRDGGPKPTGTVENTDNGPIDQLSLLSINDIEEFWKANYSPLKGTFEPVETLVSYDSEDPDSPRLCGEETYELPNAFYCYRKDVMAWDRGVFFPTAEKYFGKITITGILAHEYGHAIQWKAKLVDDDTAGLVREQQADCLAGVYMRWVAESKSKRFMMSTGDGLNHVLAGIIASRDPVLTPRTEELVVEGHGTALDRINAFRLGFDEGTEKCTQIDLDEIEERRGDLPLTLMVDQDTGKIQSGNIKITDDTLTTLHEILGEVFKPKEAPKLSSDDAKCSDAQVTPNASYCPADNTLHIDVSALQKLGTPADESDNMLIQGDNTALSVVTSRYALAVQKEKGLALDTPVAALRTACLTGVAQAAMVENVKTPSGESLTLTAGDVDEAVAGLLTNGQVASDVNGKQVPAGFTRIAAYETGLRGNADLCFKRYS